MQLLRLRPAFAGCHVTFVTVGADYRADLEPDERTSFEVVPDATEWQRFRLMLLAMRVLAVVLRTRPHVVVTTGAAPGLMAVAAARLVGARAMWIDSIANVEVLSKSGRMARRLAHRCLTQWPELAGDGVFYEGAVL